jgi:alkylation response protein AidB-like acyl-CoA dehydrogenase
LDYRDSAQEAAFRSRLRGWLAENAEKHALTGDEYWTRYGEWHRALYGAGFFGLSWPREYGGQELPPVYDVILDEELAAAGAPPRPSLGYLVTGLGRHGSPELCRRFLPGMINGTQRWCQGFSEPGAGSDLAALTTTAVRDGDEYVINGHKVWTSHSDVADWCLLLARTDAEAPRHRGISAFVISMHQPGIEQRPLTMISGISTEFGQVTFDGARVPAANMIGAPGEGWKIAMTVVSHEREPSTLGFTARYGKTVRKLAGLAGTGGSGGRSMSPRGADTVAETPPAELAWAHVQTQMLYAHVRRRLSEQLDGITQLSPGGANGVSPRSPRNSSDGSLDKLLMTWTEQAVGHAALAVAGTSDADALEAYLYSRAQSVMGGTSQIQKNIIAGRILGLGGPTTSAPPSRS